LIQAQLTRYLMAPHVPLAARMCPDEGHRR
jgi:hypothetical protein